MAVLHQAIEARNWQECENCLEGEIDLSGEDDCCLKKFKKTALELVVASPGNEDPETRNRVTRLLIGQGINVARSLVNAKNAKNWSVLQSILDLVSSLNLTEEVDERLKDTYPGNSFQKMSSDSKLGPRMEKFIKSMTRTVDKVLQKEPQSNEELNAKKLVDGMRLNDEFMDILKQFLKQQGKEPSGEAHAGDEPKGTNEGGDLRAQEESAKRLTNSYYMIFEWFSKFHQDPQEQSDNKKEKQTAPSGTSVAAYTTQEDVHLQLEGTSVDTESPLPTIDDNDIINIALRRSEDMKSKASSEPMSRDLYKTLSKKVEQFAADLVEEAHNDKELQRVMDLDGTGTLETGQEDGSDQQRIESLEILQIATEKDLKLVSC